MPVAFFIMPSALRNLFPILQNILKCALPGSSFYSAFYEMHDISIKIKNVIVFQYLNNILLHRSTSIKKILSAEYWCTMVLKFGNARREIIIKMCTKIMQLNLLISLVWCAIFGWMNTRNFDCTNFACYLFLLVYCYLCVPASC